jgi:hypothetical protein
MLLSVLLFLFAVLYILKVSVHLSEWSFFFASDYIQREQLSCVYKVLETFFWSDLGLFDLLRNASIINFVKITF